MLFQRERKDDAEHYVYFQLVLLQLRLKMNLCVFWMLFTVCQYKGQQVTLTAETTFISVQRNVTQLQTRLKLAYV